MVLTVLGTGHAAPLQNGDFASFEGWTGFIDDGVTQTTLNDAAIGGVPNFVRDAAEKSATIYAFGDSTYVAVLSQTFDLPDPMGDTLYLEFAYEAFFDNPFDYVTVSLLPVPFDPFVDPVLAAVPSLPPNMVTAGLFSVDVTPWGGQPVTLEAVVSNADFQGQDYLKLTDVRVRRVVAAVPEPGISLAMAVGILLVSGWCRRSPCAADV